MHSPCGGAIGLPVSAEKNQLKLYLDVEELFTEDKEAEVVRVEKGHGRLERREIWTSSDLEGYSDFPGLRQVAQVKTKTIILKTGQVRESTQYLITSLPTQRAGPEMLLALLRGHWGIENRLFHVKDDSFGEDRHVLCWHPAALAMSLLRATAINLLRGRSLWWSEADPLTGRAQRVCFQPLSILTTLQ